MDIAQMKNIVHTVVHEFPIKKITLFGSRADNTNRSDSDVDLIIEFYQPVSLLTLSQVRLRLEDLFGLPVDVVHGPMRSEDLLEISHEVDLYVA